MILAEAVLAGMDPVETIQLETIQLEVDLLAVDLLEIVDQVDMEEGQAVQDQREGMAERDQGPREAKIKGESSVRRQLQLAAYHHKVRTTRATTSLAMMGAGALALSTAHVADHLRGLKGLLVRCAMRIRRIHIAEERPS